MAATAAAPTATTSPPRPTTNSKFTVYLRSSDRSGTLKVRLPKRKTAQAVLRAFAGAALGDASKAEGLHLLHPSAPAAVARAFIQLLSCLDRCATVLRAAAAPLGVVLVVAVAIQVPCIPTSNGGADLEQKYGAPHARGYVADVYAVNITHIIKQLRGPCVAETAPCVHGYASLLHYVWWRSHAREQWRTYERLVALRDMNVAQAPETFGMDHERWRIHQRRYVSPEYEPARSWPEDQLVELSAALERRDWYLVDAAARNALVRKRDGRLIIVDGSVITGTQLRFRLMCARVLDAAAALFCLAFRASDLPFVSQVRVARAPRVRFDDRSIDRQSALVGVADAFATMSRLTS